MKKEINWYGVILVTAIVLLVGLIIFTVYESATYEPTNVQEATQKTLEYIGFDGKKHQAIVVHTAQHNWVLVEKR
jgi:archaellum component FlaF (FlaF/FlaG flagellin family)